MNHYSEQGWVKVTFSEAGKQIIREGQELLLDGLRELVSPNITALEDYHNHLGREHHDVQAQLSERLRAAHIARRVVTQERAVFHALIGQDLLIQKFPYLRIARPQRPEDNIGYHRDTYYGNNAYELSMLMPFTRNDTGGYLSVMSGSHRMSEAEIPWRQVTDGSVKKGSIKHSLGFLYSPKLLPDWVKARMLSVPIFPGEGLIFSKATVHGQEVNQSPQTRITCDVSLVNSLAPIHNYRSVHQDYYEAFSASPVTEQARLYRGEAPQ